MEKNMKFNKIAIKAAFLGLVLSVAPLFATEAKASAPVVFFKGKTVQEVSAQNGKFWGVAKVAKNEKSANLVIDTTNFYYVSEVMPVLENKIDMSNFKGNKDLVIAVGASDAMVEGKYKPADWKIVTIPAENSKFKVTYTMTEAGASANPLKSSFGSLLFTNDGAPYDVVTNKANVEVRTDFTAWTAVEDFLAGANGFANAGDIPKKLNAHLAKYTYKGTKLHFRLKGVDGETNKLADGRWPSKTSTVTLPAQAKAPKITVNTDKGEVSTKKEMVYLVSENGSIPDSPVWKAAPEKGKLKLSEAGVDGEADKYMFIKVAATNKKMESKITKIFLDAQDQVEVTEIDAHTKEIVTGTDGKKLVFNLKVPYDKTKGATIENQTNANYQVFVSYAGTVPTEKDKWLTLKAATTKKGKTKNGSIKIPYSKAAKANAFGDSGSKIYVRLAGDKKIVNGAIKLASPISEEKKIEPANLEQTMTITGTNPLILTDLTAGTATVPVNKETILKGSVGVDKIVKTKGAKPKIKVTTKVSGVSVKAEPYKMVNVKGTSVLTIKVSKSATKTLNGKALKFTVSTEGVSKDVTVTFTVTGA